MSDIPVEDMFATIGTADRVGADAGVIWFATHPPGSFVLSVIEYQIFDIASINAEWVGRYFERSQELVEEHKPAHPGCRLRVEHAGLTAILKRADVAFQEHPHSRHVDRLRYDIKPVRSYGDRSDKWPTTLDERAFLVRPMVDSGKIIRIGQGGMREFLWRAIAGNHLKAQIRAHRPGDASSAGELLHAFVLGVLLATTPRGVSFFEAMERMRENDARKQSGAAKPANPFGAYVPGRRPW